VRNVWVMRVVRMVAGITRPEAEGAEVTEAGKVRRTADACGVREEELKSH
jgi:tRNA U34 5-methylaminomethyl-2-thiouridine-forming methyltransferase MnmC